MQLVSFAIHICLKGFEQKNFAIFKFFHVLNKEFVFQSDGSCVCFDKFSGSQLLDPGEAKAKSIKTVRLAIGPSYAGCKGDRFKRITNY